MGAFETFVNANLGIRKPLISDIGPPSGSSKAAGIIGSEYIDTDSNFLYEKTGENNLSDWVFTRKLGDQSKDEELENSVSIISGNLQALFSFKKKIPSVVSIWKASLMEPPETVLFPRNLPIWSSLTIGST